MTDGEKLRKLAEWFDVRDASSGIDGGEVQQDLRRIAEVVDAAEEMAQRLARLRRLFYECDYDGISVTKNNCLTIIVQIDEALAAYNKASAAPNQQPEDA